MESKRPAHTRTHYKARTLAAPLAALALFAAFASHARNDTAARAQTVPEGELTYLNVSVTDDYGRNVSGLAREAFTVYDGDEKQSIQYFSVTETPQSVGIVFDVSRSMKETPALDSARGAVVQLRRQGHASNEYFLVGFDGRPRLLADWTRDDGALVAGLNKLGHVEQRKDGTALYDALALAVEKAARVTRTRPVVILVSDGRDTESKTKPSALRETLRRSGVILYAVRVTDGGEASRITPTELEGLARATGGRVYRADTASEVTDAFRRIGLELHGLYTLGFKSATPDGKWHKVRVKAQPPPRWPRLNVRTREGYYAAGGEVK